jgi:PAS domain-containing protein
MMGKSIWDVFPTLVGRPIDERYRRAVEEQVPVHFDHHSQTVDRWAEVHAYPVEDGLIVHFRDISERKRSEVRRQHETGRLRQLIDVSARVLAETTVAGLMQRIVEAAVLLTGASAGAAAYDYRSGSFRISASAPSPAREPHPSAAQLESECGVYMAMLGSAPTLRLDTEGLHSHPAWQSLADDGPRPVGLLGAGLVRVGGASGGIIVTADKCGGPFTPEDEALLSQLATVASLGLRHIEAREEAEERAHANARLLAENQQQRAFLERLLYSSPIGIGVVRGPENRFELANPAYRAIPTGSPDTPMVGRTFAEVFPAVAPAALPLMSAAYRENRPVSVREFQAAVGPGREQTAWDVDLVPLHDAQGSVDGLLIIANEVTQNVHARRQFE